MKAIQILSLFILAIMLNSCKNDEKIINNYDDKCYSYLVKASMPNAVSLIELPSGNVLKSDFYTESSSGNSEITKIIDFYGKLYVIIPGAHKIVVLNQSDYKLLNTIDFNDKGFEPVDICFSNGTDAYISIGNDSLVYVYDMLNEKLARSIKTGYRPGKLIACGNLVFVAHPYQDKVSVIEINTDIVTSNIQVASCPMFLSLSRDAKTVVCLSMGTGKIDTSQAKSPAVLSLIDVQSRSVRKTVELKTWSDNYSELFPVGMSVSINNVCFVATKTSLFNFDLSYGAAFFSINSDSYQSLIYNPKRSEMLMVVNYNGSYTAYTASAEDGSRLLNCNLGSDVLHLFPF